MDISKLSAIELQTEIDRAYYDSEDAESALAAALKEVERLRTICQDILETINTDPDFLSDAANVGDGIEKVERLAGEYYRG